MIRANARLPVAAEASYTEYVPFPIGTALENTAAIQAACDRLAARGVQQGGVIQFPAGEIPFTAAAATQVSPDEGMGVYLQAQHSNIVFRGVGKGITILKIASNKVECFVQDGANNLRFEDMTFDNSDNGPLQNQVKPGITPVPGSGVAGLGNSANAAIDQYEGADLTVKDCTFKEFIISICYIGSNANTAVAVGTLDTLNVDYDGCCQGILVAQAQHIRMNGSRYDNGVDSINGDGLGVNDPGHAIYVTNRTAAFPETITIANVQGVNNLAEIVKVRKGNAVSITNVVADSSHRGIQLENCRNLSVSNCTFRLTDLAVDGNASALFIADCGNYEISNCSIDLSGSRAWAARIVTSGTLSYSWNNKRGHLHDITMLNDFSASAGKDWIVITDQDDLVIEGIHARRMSNIAMTNAVVRMTSGNRPIIRDINCRSAEFAPATGADRLIEVDASVTGGSITWNRGNIDVVPTVNTIINAGVGTLVYRDDGVQTGTYVPTVEFATNGDFSPTYTRQQGIWTLTRDLVQLFVSVVFSTNAYTTASGQFRLNLPFTSVNAPLSIWAVAAGNYQNIVFSSGVDIQVFNTNNTAYALLRVSDTASAGVTLITTNFPPSTSGFAISFQVSYLITAT